MFISLSPSDYRVAQDFRWRGLVYKAGSGLPADMPQGAMTQFLRKDPPLIKLSNGATNGTGKKKASTKKVSSKKASKKASKKKTSKVS